MGAKDVEERAREALELAAEHAPDLARAARFADDSVRLAEELDDPVLLAKTLDARLTTHPGPDDLDVRVGTSLRLLGLVRQVPDPEIRLAAHVWRLSTALEQLDLNTVRRQLAALDVLADETRDDRARFFASSRRAMFALAEGDSVGAARLTAEAAQAGAAAGAPETENVLDSLYAELARQRGDRSALAEQATSFEERGRSTRLTAPIAEAAVLWLESGEPARARQLVDLYAPDLADLPRDGDWLVVVSKLCEAAVGSGRARTAMHCARLLHPYAGRAVLKPLAEVFAGVVEDYLALATGEVAQADRARASYRQIGADWWARRGPLGRTQDGATGPQGPRILHLHPAETGGSTRLWCVGREGAVRLVPPMPGFEYLRLLVERPGIDVPALELCAASNPAGGSGNGSGSGTLVDQQALTEHRRRVREGGSDTSGGGDADERAEQARTTVRRAIEAALGRLELHDGEVAHELRTTVRTGASCRYEPDPFRAVEWRMSHAPASRSARKT